MKKRQPAASDHWDYRQKLLEKRADVLATLGIKFDTLARMGRVAEDDQAQITHDEFVSLHLNSLDYRELRLVDEALDRLDSGGYGICLACEEPLPTKRLRALPWARYCVPCQQSLAFEAGGEKVESPTPLPVPASE
jgi:RNA polymerase-binding transcription factor DksA